MKKIALFVVVFGILFFVTGCTSPDSAPGQNNEPVQEQSSLTPAEEEMLKEIEAKNYENLTPEEQKLVEKLEKEAKEDVAKREQAEADRQQADVDLVNELLELEDRKKTGDAARGSCDAIAGSSTCVEYIGEFWTQDQMVHNCSDSGVFSNQPCPSGSAGGCNIGNGAISDLITWFYFTGGGEITELSLKSAQQVCEMNPLGRWITAN